MPKRPSKQLRTRLQNLFKGVREGTPRTGPLSESRLPISTLQKAGGWVWESDLEGRYTWCSPEVERVLGYQQRELMGKSILDEPIERSSAGELEEAISGQDNAHNVKLRATRKDGTRLTLMMNALIRTGKAGEVLGYRGVAQVISYEQAPTKRMTSRLPQKPDEINISTSPLLVPTWGDVMGFVDDGEDLRPIDEGAETAMLHPIVESDRLVVPIRLQDSLLGSIELEENQFGREWSEEDRELVQEVAEDLALSLQNARSYQLTVQALEEMREADSLKSQFLANMSHELRTPLNSIIGFSRVILKGIDGEINDTQRQDLTAIYSAGQHLLGLINDILDISRIEAGKMELSFEDVDLEDIVHGVMSTAAGLVKDKPIELVTDLPEELPPVHADNMRVRQILLNLISNAAKFTEEGQIGISTNVLKHGDRQEVLIAVFDTGPGIAPEDQERLFERFSQVDASSTRKAGGTGLGLAITQHLVDLHGGRIWVESAAGEGSTFLFTLPVSSQDQPLDESIPLLLCAHDEPAVQAILADQLENLNVRIQLISEDDDLDDLVRTALPDMVLVDMLEPEQRGLELLTNLRLNTETASSPLFSASFFPEQKAAFLLENAEFVVNPPQLHSLLQMIHRWTETSPAPSLLWVDGDEPPEAIVNAMDEREYHLASVTSLAAAQAALEEAEPDFLLINPLLDEGDGFLFSRLSPGTGSSIPTIFLMPEEHPSDFNELLKRVSEQVNQAEPIEESKVIEQLKRMILTALPGLSE